MMRLLWITVAFTVGWSIGRATTELEVRRRIRQLRKSIELAERELDELLDRQN